MSRPRMAGFEVSTEGLRPVQIRDKFSPVPRSSRAPPKQLTTEEALAMNPRSFRRVGTLLAVTTIVAAGCENAAPTASTDTPVRLSTHAPTTTVYARGSVPVTAWDPIFPAAAYLNWPTTVCTNSPAVGLDAAWQNPHTAAAGMWHPWVGYFFVAQWINYRQNIASEGPGGHSWTKYSTPV